MCIIPPFGLDAYFIFLRVTGYFWVCARRSTEPESLMWKKMKRFLNGMKTKPKARVAAWWVRHRRSRQWAGDREREKEKNRGGLATGVEKAWDNKNIATTTSHLIHTEYQTKSEDRETKGEKRQKVWRRQAWRHRKREGFLRLHREEALLWECFRERSGWLAELCEWKHTSMSPFRCPPFIPVTYREEFPDSVRQEKIEGGTGEDRRVPETLTWAEMQCDIRSITRGFSRVWVEVDKRSKASQQTLKEKHKCHWILVEGSDEEHTALNKTTYFSQRLLLSSRQCEMTRNVSST